MSTESKRGHRSIDNLILNLHVKSVQIQSDYFTKDFYRMKTMYMVNTIPDSLINKLLVLFSPKISPVDRATSFAGAVG